MICLAQGINRNTLLEDQTLEPASDIPERMEDDPSPSILTQSYTNVEFIPDGVGDGYYLVETIDPDSLSSTWGKKINAKDGYYMCGLTVQALDYVDGSDNSFINGFRIRYCPFNRTLSDSYHAYHFVEFGRYLTGLLQSRYLSTNYWILLESEYRE
jgi:hypothetical protein